MRRLLTVAACLLVAGAVGASLTLMQSPGTARLRKADEVRVQDLESLRESIRYYAQADGRLPETLEALVERSYAAPRGLRDPVTGATYGYRILDDGHFELCATFALDSLEEPSRAHRRIGPEDDVAVWMHGAGEQCFRFASERPE